MSGPVVSVVVPARDAAATLPAALDALAAQDLGVPFEVLVVDDGSSDATAALAAAHPAVTRVLRGAGEGPGAARNLGAAAAAGPVLAFTDADCVPDPAWLRAALTALEAGADVVQGRVAPAGPCGPWDRTVRVHGLSGLYETANLVVRTPWFVRVGGFRPWLRPRRSKELGEDVWLGRRLVRAGARVAYAPDALVLHAVFGGTARSFVAEKARVRFFPVMVERIPELREEVLWRRWFLNARQARFDLALTGLAGALAAPGPVPRRAMAAGLLALPYGVVVAREARGAGRRRAPAVAAARVAADTVTAGALWVGNVRARTVVL